jgi:RHS repeat-associated protein
MPQLGVSDASADPGRTLRWAQITLMGVRLYNPTTGRFLSIDPIRGGSCNTCDYTCADPINGLDLDGKICVRSRRCYKGLIRGVGDR